jgi:hypothetical protein
VRELSSYLPTIWEAVTHEVIGGVLEGGIGHEGTLFGETKRRPSAYARIRSSLDISDATLLNFGSTLLSGSSDEDSANEVRALGLDVAFTHHLNPINRFKFQSEAYLQDRDAPYLELEGDDHEHEEIVGGSEEVRFRNHPWGFYALADYKLGQRWSVGGRWDLVEPVNIDIGQGSHESAYNAYITFHQSEFARWRAQYQYADPLNGGDDSRFFLQGTFAIGTHKHQLQ